MKECPVCRRCFPDSVIHCPNDGDATTQSIMGEPVLDGRYQLERRLGQGGMGVVFQARHIFLKTAHAIKIILPDLVGNDPMLVTRFRQEALAAAAIHHPNIIAVTDFGVANGNMPFLVMEYVSGRSLHDLLATEKRLSPAKALEIIAATGAGVGAAHRQNIVHRDLKPLNIMMQEGMSIAEGLKVLDFGLAKIKSGELLGSFVQAKTSGLMGSPFYMAPEQWSDEDPDARSDIYSLGVILYQMLGGEVPFKGSSIPSIMKKHLTEEPPSFNKFGVTIPEEIERVVRRALAKEPEGRPATVEQFITELREAVNLNSASVKTAQGTTHDLESQTMVSMPHISLASREKKRETGAISLSSQPHLTEITLRVHTDPPQSRVFVNNISVGVSDSAGELIVPGMLPGIHRVRVVHEGHAEWERQMQCGDSAECSVEARLQRIALDPLRTTPITTSELNISRHDPMAGTISSTSLDREERQTETARLRADEEAKRRAEEEARLRADEEKDRKHKEELERISRQTRELEEKIERMAANMPASEVNLDSTQQQRYGIVTQRLGTESLSGINSGQVARKGGDTMAAIPPAVVAAEPKKSSSSSILLIAAAIVIILGAGGTGAYLYMHKAATGGGSGVSIGEGTTPGVPVGHTNTVKAEMVSIPGGAFKMGRTGGQPQEIPPHDVKIAPFMMDVTEVTNAEYAEFVHETNHTPPSHWANGEPLAGQEMWPVINVSFNDVQAFAEWRSKRDGVTYRLPTEEEWEYAARGGDRDLLYPWGNTWAEDHAVVKESSPRPVGTYPDGKSRWGVLDLIGNVWEWTSSKASIYTGSDLPPVPPEQRDWVVIRGGSYASDTTGPRAATATFRDWVKPTTTNPVLGFRLVRTMQ